MSGSAQILRLQLHLESMTLSRVLDRLAVLGLVPRVVAFRRGTDGQGRLRLTLDAMAPPQAANLIARLEQIPAVVVVTQVPIHPPRRSAPQNPPVSM